METLALSIFLSVLITNAVIVYKCYISQKNKGNLIKDATRLLQTATSSFGVVPPSNISDLFSGFEKNENSVDKTSKEIVNEIIDNLNFILKSKDLDLFNLMNLLKLEYHEIQETLYTNPGNLTPKIAIALEIDEDDLFAPFEEIKKKYGNE